MLVTGAIVAANITGHIASQIMLRAHGGFQMGKGTADVGYVIVNWSHRAEHVAEQLLLAMMDPRLGHHNVLVVTEGEVPALVRESWQRKSIMFETLDWFDKKKLELLSVQKARGIVVMADDNHPDPDAKTALHVLAFQKLYEEKGIPTEDRPRIVCEVRNHRKMQVVQDAGADEIVCHEDYGLGALTQALLYGKITDVYQDLLSYGGDTCEVYIVSGPREDSSGDIAEDAWNANFRGKSFSEVSQFLSRTRDDKNPVILIGIRTDGKISLNPRGKDKLKSGDDLVIISYTRPTPNDFKAKARASTPDEGSKARLGGVKNSECMFLLAYPSNDRSNGSLNASTARWCLWRPTKCETRIGRTRFS